MSYDEADGNAVAVVTAPACYQYDFVAHVEELVYGYYLTLEIGPHDAWRYYTVGAQYMHVDGDVACAGGSQSQFKPAVGHHQIHANIVYQQFTECKFRVRSINVQQHTYNAYMVLVTGELSRGQYPAVMFIQSFMIDRIPEINQLAITNSILKVYTTV